MDITENDIENYRERINDLKNKSSQRRAKRDLIRLEIKKKRNQLKEIGLNSEEEAKEKCYILDRKFLKLKRRIEKELQTLEKRFGAE